MVRASIGWRYTYYLVIEHLLLCYLTQQCGTLSNWLGKSVDSKVGASVKGPLLILSSKVATTAALSDRTRTAVNCQLEPHNATATTGTNSLAAMWHSTNVWSWNQDPNAPHSQTPDASVVICWGRGGRANNLPFHLGGKTAQQWISDPKSWGSLRWQYGWWAYLARSIILRRKVHPGCFTVTAWLLRW